jgi:hypothetical protein
LKTATLLLFILISVPTYADKCDFSNTSNTNYVHELGDRYDDACYGDSADENLLSKAVNEWASDSTTKLRTTEEVAKLQASALQQLENIDSNLRAARGLGDTQWRSIFDVTLGHLSEARRLLGDYDHGLRAAEWEVDDLRILDNSLDLKPPVGAACSSGYDDVCRATLVAAGSLLRGVELTHTVLNKLVAKVKIAPLYEGVAVLDSQWDDYFEKGRSQYIWELAFNSWRYSKSLEGDNLQPPPAGQWILLHPTAAVEYVESDENGDSQYNAVAIIEVLGYNRLRWGSDGLLSKFPLGVSAITTISLSDKGDRFGYGGMIHINNKFSLGAAKRDSGSGSGSGKETVWFLSVDLGELFRNNDESVKKTFRRLYN